jgi:hypothetical protein
MSPSLTDVLDYVAYAHGRGQSFPYTDFIADGLKTPQKLRESAVVFPANWDKDRREKWRRRHKLSEPRSVSAERLMAYRAAPILES